VLISSCLLATGCIIPYAYPKLSYVPGCNPTGPKTTDIHAFRVDVNADCADFSTTGEYTLTEITPRSDGSIPLQARLTVERGVYLIGPLTSNIGRFHSTGVRLYSPGWKLIELNSGDPAAPIRWQLAENWSAREKAIDDLLHPPALHRGDLDVGGPLPKLAGSTEAAKRPFVFAAAEYEQIAASVSDPAETARLRDKARLLIEIKPASAASDASATQSTPRTP